MGSRFNQSIKKLVVGQREGNKGEVGKRKIEGGRRKEKETRKGKRRDYGKRNKVGEILKSFEWGIERKNVDRAKW